MTTPDETRETARDWIVEASLALDAATVINERMLRTGRVEALHLSNHDRLVSRSAAVEAAVGGVSDDRIAHALAVQPLDDGSDFAGGYNECLADVRAILEAQTPAAAAQAQVDTAATQLEAIRELAAEHWDWKAGQVLANRLRAILEGGKR